MRSLMPVITLRVENQTEFLLRRIQHERVSSSRHPRFEMAHSEGANRSHAAATVSSGISDSARSGRQGRNLT